MDCHNHRKWYKLSFLAAKEILTSFFPPSNENRRSKFSLDYIFRFYRIYDRIHHPNAGSTFFLSTIGGCHNSKMVDSTFYIFACFDFGHVEDQFKKSRLCALLESGWRRWRWCMWGFFGVFPRMKFLRKPILTAFFLRVQVSTLDLMIFWTEGSLFSPNLFFQI